MSSPFQDQISFKKYWKWHLDAYWVWTLTFQDSNFNLVPPTVCFFLILQLIAVTCRWHRFSYQYDHTCMWFVCGLLLTYLNLTLTEVGLVTATLRKIPASFGNYSRWMIIVQDCITVHPSAAPPLSSQSFICAWLACLCLVGTSALRERERVKPYFIAVGRRFPFSFVFVLYFIDMSCLGFFCLGNIMCCFRWEGQPAVISIT